MSYPPPPAAPVSPVAKQEKKEKEHRLLRIIGLILVAWIAVALTVAVVSWVNELSRDATVGSHWVAIDPPDGGTYWVPCISVEKGLTRQIDCFPELVSKTSPDTAEPKS
jgi:hypothetical protein